MAKIEHGTWDKSTTPAWIGDYLGREHVLPGGARLNAADFSADADGRKYVPSGTIVGRTYAERDAGTGFGPVDFTAATSVDDDEVYLVVFDVYDAVENPDVELYRHGSLVKENRLPDWSTLDPIVQTEIRTLYQTTIGAV